MVNVQRQAPVAPARDETALDIFRHQWELYRKFLTHDYLENAGAYAELHRFLNDNVTHPFAFVDLACGDASGVVSGTGSPSRRSWSRIPCLLLCRFASAASFALDEHGIKVPEGF